MTNRMGSSDVSNSPVEEPDREATADRSPLASAETTSQRSATVWSRFRRHRLAMIGTVCLLILAVTALAAPLISPDPYRTDLSVYRTPPSLEYPLGTDDAGRNIFSRVLYAGRVSLSVGLVAVSIYAAIGIVLGAFAGYYGGWIDSTIMRMADVVLAFPGLIIILTLVSVLGPSIYNVMLAIGLLGWPPIARLLRAELLSLRERDFISAARAIGASDSRIIVQHMLPNAMAPIIVTATLGIAVAILLEAALSFLGLGVQPPTASWGNMLNAAQSLTILESMPWLWIPPGLMIAIAVLSINFIGDGLRDALDPYLHHR